MFRGLKPSNVPNFGEQDNRCQYAEASDLEQDPVDLDPAVVSGEEREPPAVDPEQELARPHRVIWDNLSATKGGPDWVKMISEHLLSL